MAVKKIIGTLGLVAVIATAIVAPAGQANATVTGAVGIQCTASLPSFPSPGGSGTCSGTGVGAGAGVDDQGAPYAVAGPGNFNASFSYNETCTVLNEPPLIGSASGTATATGLTSTQGSADLTTNFAWTRVGLTAVLVTSGTRLSFSNGHTATAVLPDVGVAGFAPLLGPNNVCPVGGPLQAVVVGADVQPI